MKKRLASLQAGLLALVLLFSLLPVSSFATELDAAPDSVITTQEDAAADRNTAAAESGEHTSSASDAQPAAGGTETTASDSSAGTEQDETLTSAPSDTTSEAADTVEIPNTQDAAHEDDVNRMVAVQDTGFSAADFSFYEVRTWTGSHYERMRLEKPTQLVENDGKYTLYFPYGGAGTYKWNVRVEAPVNYSDTFSLYYMTFLTGDGITTDEGYSVNAYSSLHTKEDASVVQSVESDIHPHSTPAALGGNIYYSKTITLIWTENGEKKTCLIDVKPYCDMELSTNFNISEKNGSKPSPRPLEQIDSTTYKTNLVKGRESYAQIVLMDSTKRLQVSYEGSILADGVTNTGCTIPLNTAEVGTREYKIELRDSKGEAEAKTYTLIAETLPYDYTPESDAKKTTKISPIPAKMYKVTNEDTATLTFGLTVQQIEAIEKAGGQTSYLWTNNGQVLSTESTCKVPTEYNVDKAIFSVTVTNTVDGIAWSKSFSIPVKIAIKGNPPGIFYAKIKTDSTELTFGHTASDLKAVVDDSNAPTDLLYQWYSKNGNSLKKITDATAATYTPPTNAVGTVEYCCIARVAYAELPTVRPSSITGEDRWAKITVKPHGWTAESGITGRGTEDDPYILRCAESFAALRDEVNAGISYAGSFFKLAEDITLPADWTPIGCLKDESVTPGALDYADKGRNMNPFSGTLDGDGHTLTMAKGSRPLLMFARKATVRNLNIQGERIVGNGLLEHYVIDYGTDGYYNNSVPNTITIENCHIVGDTNITGSGFLSGYASGLNIVMIVNCSVGENVVIGCDKDQSEVGSLAGHFNGSVMNCTSAATVYGKSRVGGLVGYKGQSMGPCSISSSSFTGKVIATGDYAGGILGSGYNQGSAPNSPWATIKGCFVTGRIQGRDGVGGITGGEPGVVQCWDNGTGGITDNVFYGEIHATGTSVGAIVGTIRSLNKNTLVDNNYYLAGCGTSKGIGSITTVDTKCKPSTLPKDTEYICTSDGYTNIFFKDGDYSREDDPAGKDADKLSKAVTNTVLKDGTVVQWLNTSESSYHNWMQGTVGPILSNKAIAYDLEITGEINQHYVGDTLDLSGLTLTAKWSDGTTTNVPLNDPNLKITGYNSSEHGKQTVTLQYGAAKVEIVVTVLYKEPEDITVTITLLGDKAHGDNGQVHGLSKGGLTAWVSGHKVEVTTNMTVWDALQQLPGVTWDNPTGNYIKSVTYGGVTIGEFTNGKNSGWMYTLNGKYPMLGVSEQYLKKGDVIVFHYTDDYTLEAADMGPAPGEKKTADEVIALINAIGVVDLTKGDVIAKARAAYDALSAADKKLVTNYQTLLDAEAAYAKLVAELGKKADSIYKTTGDYLAKLGTPGVGSIGGEWMALGLARSGRTVPEGYYDAVVKYVKDNIDSNGRLDKNKATENARIILALTAIGKDVTNVDGHDLLAGLNEMSYLSKQGINGAIFTLIALDSHSYTPAGDVTRDKLVQVILDAQISSDGGWSLDGKNADVDMTAMAIQALAAYYKSNSSAKKAVDKGLSWLSSVQQNDGGFTSWGAANSESCAQVIVALTALGIDPTKDSRFIKNGVSVLDALCSFAVNGGGFKHLATETSANGMATEQGFYALVAYYRLLNGQTSLYDMTDVKLEGVKAEEPVDDTDKSDDTADTDTPADTEVEEASSGGQVVLWVVIGVVAVGGIAALAVTSKKRHGRDAE